MAFQYFSRRLCLFGLAALLVAAPVRAAMPAGETPVEAFKARQIAPNTWFIHGYGASAYLVSGSRMAIMVDSGMSYNNIQAFAQTLTPVPVTSVVNTHGHFDHTGGDMYFQHVYMDPKQLPSAKVPYPSLDATKFKTDYPVTFVKDGYVFDLGGRTLEVISIPAHQRGSIALLDKTARILFSGDEVAPAVALVWTGSKDQPYVETHYNNMLKLEKRLPEFDTIWSGHASEAADAKPLLEGRIALDKAILDGTLVGNPLSDDRPRNPDMIMPEPEYKRAARQGDLVELYDSRFIHFPAK